MKNRLKFWFKGGPMSICAIGFYQNTFVQDYILDTIHASKRGWPAVITLHIIH